MESPLAENLSPALDSLLGKVYWRGGYDFRDYRRGTVIRRLARRLHAAGVKTYPEYMQYLDANPAEYQKLADDLTIKTSGFFRSPCSWQQVARLVLPELFRDREIRAKREVRFWSAACARGEEPYTLAILLAEFLEPRWRDFQVAIYASDISRRALDQARTGRYSAADLEGVPAAIRRDYFIQREKGYELRGDIRQRVSFACFDLTSTGPPPLAGLDCIFCCNVLIYFQRQLQERVLNMLCDALATPGYLVLGEVETPTSSLSGKLECIDSKAKMYRKV